MLAEENEDAALDALAGDKDEKTFLLDEDLQSAVSQADDDAGEDRRKADEDGQTVDVRSVPLAIGTVPIAQRPCGVERLAGTKTSSAIRPWIRFHADPT